MSESAVRVKHFFFSSLRNSAFTDTLLPDGAEDKATLGSDLSADSGAKTRLGRAFEVGPSSNKKNLTGIGINSDKTQGSGDRVPSVFPPFPIDSFRPFRSYLETSVLSSDPCPRPQLLHEPIPLTGFRNHYSASWARPTTALTRASTKELFAAGPVARDKLPV